MPALLSIPLVACAIEPSETSDEAEITGGGAALASQWQSDRAMRSPGCTATLIDNHFALTALHCMPSIGSRVRFYASPGQVDETQRAVVVNMFQYPGTDVSRCIPSNPHRWDGHGCSNGYGFFSDILLLELGNDTDVGLSDLPSRPAATMAWFFPGGGTGTKVGSGTHNGVSNPLATLKQINDNIVSGDDLNGAFYTSSNESDPGDSGGPFYFHNQMLGTMTGGEQVGLNDRNLHTSVPAHLDWILGTIRYRWAGSPPQTNTRFTGSLYTSFTNKTEKVCQYACEKTASCEAYNFDAAHTCTLVGGITGIQTASGTTSALHYGQSGGRSGAVVGYVRSDGFNAVVTKAANGHIHETTLQGTGWVVGDLSNNAPPAIASRLSAYRRADGTSSVVYRSTSNRLIEVALLASGWTWFDLSNNGGLAPVGDPTAYVRADGESAVVYRSANGHINEMRLGPSGWIATDLTVDASLPVAASSDPSAFIRSDGFSSVVFRAGTSVWELYKQPFRRWGSGAPSTASTNAAPAAAGRPYGYTHHDGTNAIAYRTTDNRIAELWLDGAGWHAGTLASPNTAVGDPMAYVRADAIEAIVYRGPSSSIVELANWPWQAGTLQSSVTVGDPLAYVRSDGFNAVVFPEVASHVGELSIHRGQPLWSLGQLE